MSSAVRPRKTGLIVFSSRILSVFTGLLFLVMMTRSLVPTQFGLWEVITDIVVFASYPTGLLTYWATREVARGKVIGKTTIVLNLLASGLGIGIFLVFAAVSYTLLHASFMPFVLSLILVPLSYWNQATLALVGGYDPGIGAKSLLVSEPAKLLVAFPLLFDFKLKIYGIIVAIAVSFLVQNIASTYQLRKVTTDEVDVSIGRKWLRDSHVPAIAGITAVFAVADTFAASLGQGGTGLAGYYQAAFQVATLVSYSLYLSAALYPLLLREGSGTPPGELLKTSLEFTLLFALPMAAGTIALAPQILYLLSPTYVVSSPGLVILSFAAVASAISWVFDQALMGRERVDLIEEDRTRRILGSDLMFVPVANLAYSLVYVTSVFFIGKFSTGAVPALYVDYWAISQLVLTVCLVVGKSLRLHRKIRIEFSRAVLFYLLSAAVMGGIVYLVGNALLSSGLGSLDYGLRLGFTVLAGGAIYFGLLAALDLRVRGYVQLLLNSVTRRG